MRRNMEEGYLYLGESRIMARRHLSDDDRKAFVRDVMKCISEGKFSILDRNVNVDFLVRNRITEPVAIKVIKYYLDSESVIGVVKNISRNYRGMDDDLYICELSIDRPRMYIYLKIQKLEGGRMVAISFHDQDEPIYVDYSLSRDYTDNSFNETAAERWMRSYNSRNPDTPIIRSSVKGNVVRFEFDDNVEVDYTMKNHLAHVIPPDMGVDMEKTRRSAIWEGNIISFRIMTRSYNGQSIPLFDA